MTERVHLLGIRHHGPGSARSVRTALDEIRPSAVLVELPADVQPALRWVGHEGLEPPVALLGWRVDEPRNAAFAPLAVFSPEWQAMRWAADNGVDVRAIDLPLSITMAGPDDEPGEGGSGAGPGELVGDTAPPDPLAVLAAAAGESEPERWWEDVIEHRGDGPPAFAAVAEAMAAVRDGFLPSGREVQREAHMRRAIRAVLKAGDGPVAVVCGAWHVPALDVTSVTTSVDAALLRKLPKSKVAVAWVPWSHRRLAAATGYGAGVDSPGWYAHVFAHPGADGVGRFFAAAARVLREEGDDASPDHLIGAARLVDVLAAVRQRPRPGLAETLDAAEAVFAGSGARALVERALVVGDAVGAVPPEAPQVPLARDVAAAQRRTRLKPTAQEKVVELDLRSPNGLARSHLLHRLAALEVWWGRAEAGRTSTGTFRETWRIAWDPEFSLQLVAASSYGTTLESAATAALLERAERSRALVELVAVLDRALLADLHHVVEPCVRRLSDVGATDPDVGHLIDALGPLAAALRYGDVRGTDTAALRVLFDGFVVRVLAGLHAAFSRLDDDAAAAAVERLGAMQAALAMVEHPAREGGFSEVLSGLSEHRMIHGSIQGRATRLLHDAGAWPADKVEARLARALSPGTPAASGAAFVEGFVAGSGTVLLHDAPLRDVIDGWLASLTPDAFDRVVPLLRRTFGAFEPAERRQLMLLVAKLADDSAPVWFGADLDAGRAALALDTVRSMLGLAVEPPATPSAEVVTPS